MASSVSVVSDIQTVTFSGAPAAGAVTLLVAGVPWRSPPHRASRNQSREHGVDAIFAPTYVNPFVVTVAGQVITVTANPAGPFAYMPLGTIVVLANTSATTITVAHGTTGTQETYATISGVEKMPFPTSKRDIETYLTFDVGSNGYKRKIGKFKDAGDIAMDLVFTNDSTQNNITGLASLFEAGNINDFRIAVPTKNPGDGCHNAWCDVLLLCGDEQLQHSG